MWPTSWSSHFDQAAECNLNKLDSPRRRPFSETLVHVLFTVWHQSGWGTCRPQDEASECLLGCDCSLRNSVRSNVCVWWLLHQEMVLWSYFIHTPWSNLTGCWNWPLCLEKLGTATFSEVYFKDSGSWEATQMSELKEWCLIWQRKKSERSWVEHWEMAGVWRP